MPYLRFLERTQYFKVGGHPRRSYVPSSGLARSNGSDLPKNGHRFPPHCITPTPTSQGSPYKCMVTKSAKKIKEFMKKPKNIQEIIIDKARLSLSSSKFCIRRILQFAKNFRLETVDYIMPQRNYLKRF